MKKLMVILAVLLMAVSAQAQQGNKAMGEPKIFDMFTYTAAHSANMLTSTVTNTNRVLELNNVSGFFAISTTVNQSSNGTGAFYYLTGTDEANVITPTGSTAIATGVGKTSGANSDGRVYYSFTPPPCKYIGIQVVEEGSGNLDLQGLQLIVH